MILVQDIGWRAGGEWRLREMNFEIKKGRVLAIVGPNGAGKSSLLKILSGEMRSNTGSILFQNKPLEDWSVHELARKRAVLPQFSTLSFSYEVWEVVILGRAPWRETSSKEQNLAIAWEAMRVVDIADLAARDYATLSGGEKQRVHLARVLAQLWPIHDQVDGALFLDEPTSSLDLAQQHRVLQLAQRWARMGAAVVTVLHDLNLALNYADEALILKKGIFHTLASCREALSPQSVYEVFEVRAERVRSNTNEMECLLFEVNETNHN